MNPAAIFAAAATAATITLAGGSFAGAQQSCQLTAQPWDGKSYALAVVAEGEVRHLQTAQDGRQVPPQTWTVDGLTQIWWAARNPAQQTSPSHFYDVYDVAGCEIVGGYRGIAGKQPSLTLQAASTTTTAPPTTTTAAVTTSTTAPTTSTTAAPPAATTAPQPLTEMRVTPAPPAAAVAAPRLPETGRRTWPQVRLSLGLLAVGVAALQLARVMQQDDELEQGDR